jgi:8-oxo-dGTP pyrophosphatase MutT (NUDIX family)
MVECISIYGKKVLVPKEKLIVRPAAYGIIVQDGKILLLNSKSTDKLWFPGGGINPDEKLKEALKREVKEEAGIGVKIERLFYFEETFFYYDPLNEAYHNFSFFFSCKPLSIKLLQDDQVNDLESDKPRWISLTKLKIQDCQTPAGKIIGIYKKTINTDDDLSRTP